MKPIEFKHQTKVLNKPENMTDEECQSLPVFSNGKQVISCWAMTWKERFQALLFGKVWLSVYSGHTQPPVWLSVEKEVIE